MAVLREKQLQHIELTSKAGCLQKEADGVIIIFGLALFLPSSHIDIGLSGSFELQ